jgi:PAS domain S-box-containing protein
MAHMRKKTILVIDDEEGIRILLSEMLAANYRVLQAASAKDARKIWLAEDIFLILCDIKMPHEDGFHVLDTLHKDKPSALIIMISGHGDRDTIKQSLRQGAFDYLDKPFTLLDLQQALDRALKFYHLQNENITLKINRGSIARIVEDNFHGILVTNDQGRVVYLNSAIERMFDSSKGELLGIEFGAISADPYTEITIYRRNGESGFAEVRTSKITWDGKPATLAMFHDVTERKRAEERLIEANNEASDKANVADAAQKYTDHILNSLSEMLFVVTVDGIIRTANRKARIVLGYQEMGLVHTKFEDIIDTRDDAFVLEEFRQLLASIEIADTTEISISLKTKTNELLPVLITVSPMKRLPISEGLLVFSCRDLRESKLLKRYQDSILTQLNDLANRNFHLKREKIDMIRDDVLRKILDGIYHLNQTINMRERELVDLHNREKDAQARLVQSARLSTLGEMAGGIAHEIKNPLAVIDGRTRQIEQMVSGNSIDLEKVVQFSQIAQKHCKLITRIIDGLNKFSREGSLDPFHLENLNNIIYEAIEICKFKLQSFDVDSINLSMDSELTIICRKTQVQQVIVNLISNSIDAIADLQERWIRIEVTDDLQAVEIAISDSGPGIPLETQAKIFNPFFTTKEIGKGTGLGLSISRGIIEDHHGTLYIDNTCKNTRFVMVLAKSDPVAKTA